MLKVLRKIVWPQYVIMAFCGVFIFYGVAMALAGLAWSNHEVGYVITMFGMAFFFISNLILSMTFRRMKLMAIFGALTVFCIGEGTMVTANMSNALYPVGIHMPSVYGFLHG
jgi:hypothetical protein